MRTKRFRRQDLAVLLCICAMFVSVMVPALSQNAILSRMAVCSNNMKQIGVGLELWRRNSGRYPPWDMPWMAGGNPNIGPWPDVLIMQKGYDIENIEAHRVELEAMGTPPEFFIKTVDDDRIFRCPEDHPHAHRINEQRSRAWSFWREDDKDGYAYSYGIAASAANRAGLGTYEDDDGRVHSGLHPDASSQILAADGLWSWIMNYWGAYVDNPNAGFNAGPNRGWANNCMGYFHGNGRSANVVVRDGAVKRVNYGVNGNGINTEELFFYGRSESLTVFH